MDKYEFKLSLDEINALIREQRFEEAANIADTIDWNHVKSVKTLGRIGEVYKIVGDTGRSRDIMEIAYKREPQNPSVVYMLCELSISLYSSGALQSDLARALQLLQEYQGLEPSNPKRLILQYRMYDVSHVSDGEKIEVLEQLRKEQPSARWEFELARLYAQSGQTESADQLCTDVAEIFGGRYGEQARRLQQEIRSGAYAPAGASVVPHLPEETSVPAGQGGSDRGEAPSRGEKIAGETPSRGGEVPFRDNNYSGEMPFRDNNYSGEMPSRDNNYSGEAPSRGDNYYAEAPSRDSLSGGSSSEMTGNAAPVYEFAETGPVKVSGPSGEPAAPVRGTGDTYEAYASGASADAALSAAAAGYGETSAPGAADSPQPGSVTDTETSINEVMAEWERIRADIRRANDEKRAQRILEDTGNILNDFDETARHGLLEDIEKGVARQRRQVRGGEYGASDGRGAHEPRRRAADYDERLDNGASYYEEPAEPSYEPAEPSYGPGEPSYEPEYLPEQGQYDDTGYASGQDVNDARAYAPEEESYAEEAGPEDGPAYLPEQESPYEPVSMPEVDGDVSRMQETPAAPGSRQSVNGPRMREMPSGAQDQAASFEVPEQYAEPYDEREAVKAPAPDAVPGISKQAASDGVPFDNEDDDVRIYDGPASDAATRRWNAEEVHRAIRHGRADRPVQVQEAPPAAEPPAEEEDYFDETDEISVPADLPPQGRKDAPAPAADRDDVYGEAGEELPQEAEREDADEPAEYDGEPQMLRANEEEELPAADDEEGRQQTSEDEAPAEEEKPAADTADGEKEKAGKSTASSGGRRELTREERRLFGPVCRMKDNVDQLTEALEQISLSSTTGNVIILGNEATSDRVAKGMLDIMRRSDRNFTGRIARTNGESLNRLDPKGFERTFIRLENGALIITQASDIAPKTMERLYKELEVHEHGLILILTDGNKKMEQFRRDNGKYLTSFTAVINIRPLDDKALIAYAKDYAISQDFSIDEFGQLALAQRISSMQTQSHHVTLKEVRDLVDEAIGYASKKNLHTLMEILSRKRYDEEDRIILHEKDFMHY